MNLGTAESGKQNLFPQRDSADCTCDLSASKYAVVAIDRVRSTDYFRAWDQFDRCFVPPYCYLYRISVGAWDNYAYVGA